MAEKKPFYVELTYTGVVMAADERDAERQAESHARDIVSDAPEPRIDAAVELRSMAHLNRLDDGWDASCGIYGSSDTIGTLLPAEDPPARCTKTVDMFEAPGSGA